MTESQNHQTLAAQNSNIYGDAITQRSDFYLCPSVRKIGKTNVLFRVNHPVNDSLASTNDFNKSGTGMMAMI